MHHLATPYILLYTSAIILKSVLTRMRIKQIFPIMQCSTPHWQRSRVPTLQKWIRNSSRNTAKNSSQSPGRQTPLTPDRSIREINENKEPQNLLPTYECQTPQDTPEVLQPCLHSSQQCWQCHVNPYDYFGTSYKYCALCQPSFFLIISDIIIIKCGSPL